MSEDIDALKAQLAEAEARAAQAEAIAARAQAEALKAKLEAESDAPEATAVPAAPEVAPAAPEVAPEAAPAPAAPAPEAPAPAAPEAPEPFSAQPQAAFSAQSTAAPAPFAASGTAAAAAAAATPATAPALPDASSFAASIAQAYDFQSPSITLGTLLDGTTPVPGVNTRIPLAMFNRHLLVAGATGTGKTRTLQLLTEGLSAAGTSVLLCDVKGDLTGLGQVGESSEKLLERTAANGQEWAADSFPIDLLSLGGATTQFEGTPIRARIADFGPLLLARALSLNTTQEQALQLIFSWAQGEGLDLIDLADLRSVITFLTSKEGAEQLAHIGGVSKATAGVILRALTALESQGADEFFGEPGFDTGDLLRNATDGRGIISLLGVGDISSRPALVSAVIMWMLNDLFTSLPEVGDVEQPRLVFFFDEAHLLFADATKEFVRQVVQTVRLIRSKGVGVVFVTQTPKDIPGDVLAQLGSRIQHGLRAITPDDQRKLKATVDTFPETPLALDEVLTTLGTGQAVVTVLGEDGRPTPVAPTALWAPASVMGPASDTVLSSALTSSPLYAKYAKAENPESAEELLAERKAEAEAAAAEAKAAEEARVAEEKEAAAEAKAKERAAERRAKQVEGVAGQILRTAAREITKSFVKR